MFIEKIKAQEVKYINLSKKISTQPGYTSNYKTCICQLESEEANLQTCLFNLTTNEESIEKLSVDHLTGG